MDTVSNLGHKTLNIVQFPTIQPHTKTGFWEKRSNTENRTALLGNAVILTENYLPKRQKRGCDFPECFHGNTSYCHAAAAAVAAAKSLQSCLTLCGPTDSMPLGSPIPGILQARTLEWAAISFSNAWKWKVKVKSLSRVRLIGTPWIVPYQSPPSMGFSRQEYWSRVPFPSPFYCHRSVKIIQHKQN